MAWGMNGTPDTLSGTADVITISDLTAKKFNVFLHHQLATTATNNRVTYDNNSNTDYAWRQSVNGSEATATSQNYTNWNNGLGGSDDRLSIVHVVNLDSEEKLGIGWQVAQNATGAGTAPFRREWVDKCDTTTNTGQFTRIDMNNSGAGDYASGSNLTAIGTD